MLEIRAERWSDLISYLYEDSWNNDLKRHRSKWVFRGVSDCQYHLEPSLMRVGDHYPEVEMLLLNDFQQYARSEASPGDSIWSWLAVAQHHGLPTRLLDWTYSPYVALHFATASLGADVPDRDGAIWCVNYGETNTLLSDTLKHHLQDRGKHVFSVEMLDTAVPSLKAFDLLRPSEFVVFLEPPSLDARIVNQVALFSVMSRPATLTGQPKPAGRLDQFLQWEQQQRDAATPALYRKVIIPAGLKWEIRDKLDQANITERVLLPGLDGLSSWLKRHYTKRAWPSTETRGEGHGEDADTKSDG